MEIEIEDLDAISTPSLRSLRIPRNSSTERRDLDSNDDLHYTSLKDIICNTPTRWCSLYEGNVCDSNIAIRNELVKRAASVYLQSAALLATRNQNCIVAFWERVKSRAGSWWRIVGGNTIRACLLPVFQFLNHIGNFRSLP
ncbi:unnamed protein product [Trifolium pratense]|uniref:Uncharacterized protein n=1 Tax=Trifolium pratense TaxID=57577 RepID=A0ACB0M7M8_TRIPR|nr:unnamed protein product [Trifolium pratense]